MLTTTQSLRIWKAQHCIFIGASLLVSVAQILISLTSTHQEVSMLATDLPYTIVARVGQRRDEKANLPADVIPTVKTLQRMGVNFSETDMETLQELPSWSQIVENYGSAPVIRGLDRCSKFREIVPAVKRKVAPTGLYSTGTNLLFLLLKENCIPPAERDPEDKFAAWQVPWGKHNPITLRNNTTIHNGAGINKTSYLPIVTVRHPYSWIWSVCQHPYGFLWPHDKTNCERVVGLTKPIGSKSTMFLYDSLIHAWRDWNRLFFAETNLPYLMVRHEDLVFRPEGVVEQICSCAGGTMRTPFSYTAKSAKGNEHGGHRSDLLKAWMRYGQPLARYHSMYSAEDWEVIRKVLKDDFGIMDALGYTAV